MMLDLSLMLSTFICFIFIFLILQIIVFRSIRILHLPNAFIWISMVTALICGLLSYVFLEKYYSSQSCFLTATIGAILSAIFLSGFYGFVGPICADRSLSVHILLLAKRGRNENFSINHLRQRYTQEKVIGRRIKEMEDAMVIKLDNDIINVTSKGNRLAIIYEIFIKLLNLKENF